MKSANIDTDPNPWADIVRWLNAGEEIELRRADRAVAKVIPLTGPAESKPVEWPDFVGRARKIWGDRAPGISLVDALLREREERL